MNPNWKYIISFIILVVSFLKVYAEPFEKLSSPADIEEIIQKKIVEEQLQEEKRLKEKRDCISLFRKQILTNLISTHNSGGFRLEKGVIKYSYIFSFTYSCGYQIDKKSVDEIDAEAINLLKKSGFTVLSSNMNKSYSGGYQDYISYSIDYKITSR